MNNAANILNIENILLHSCCTSTVLILNNLIILVMSDIFVDALSDYSCATYFVSMVPLEEGGMTPHTF